MWSLLVAAILSFNAGSPEEAIKMLEEKWATVNDYTCTLESYIKKGKKEEHRIYEYKFMKPGWVYMKILKGDNKGAVVSYNPNTNKVRAKKGGILGVVKLTFDPTNKRVLSIRGHRVDRSHFGYILKRWEDYLKNANVRMIGDTTYRGEEAIALEATGCDSLQYHGTVKEILYIGKDGLPLGFEQFDGKGELIHSTHYTDLKINVGLKEEDFKI